MNFNSILSSIENSKITDKGHPRYSKMQHMWELYTDGTLIIKGHGIMNYSFDQTDYSWYGLWPDKSAIKGVILSNRIKSLQEDVFTAHRNLEWIFLPRSFILPNDDYEYNDFFEDTSLKVVYGFSATDAEKFAKSLNINFCAVKDFQINDEVF